MITTYLSSGSSTIIIIIIIIILCWRQPRAVVFPAFSISEFLRFYEGLIMIIMIITIIQYYRPKSQCVRTASFPRHQHSVWSTTHRRAPVIYCRRNQSDKLASPPVTTDDDVLDAGDSGSEGRGVKMISDSQVHVLNAGESVVLECYFNAAKYNMFDYPLLWKKVLSTPLLISFS